MSIKDIQKLIDEAKCHNVSSHNEQQPLQNDKDTKAKIEPKFWSRDEIIKLSLTEICDCGRPKIIHCPRSGHTKVRAKGKPFFLTLEYGEHKGDIMKDCQLYHCERCGLDFNDIDWYFRCAAPKANIDTKATLAKLKEKTKQEKINYHLDEWTRKILAGQKFDHNDATQFKWQCGGGYSLEDFAKNIRHAEDIRVKNEEIKLLREEAERLAKKLTAGEQNETKME